jgi:hypothetical protein
MDNRINEIRKKIRALRISMLEAEAIMHDRINRDEECSFVAGEVLKMRGVMSQLVRERTLLGDREPILAKNFFIPRRPLAQSRSLLGRSDGASCRPKNVPDELEIAKRGACHQRPLAAGMVPVERIELPTFGLQNSGSWLLSI